MNTILKPPIIIAITAKSTTPKNTLTAQNANARWVIIDKGFIFSLCHTRDRPVGILPSPNGYRAIISETAES